MALEELLKYYQDRFDYLWEHRLNPLEMREIGCRIIYIKKLIKEKAESRTA